MARVLIQKSHYQEGRPCGWSGAPGECEWVLDLCGRIDAKRQGLFDVVWSNGDLQSGENDAAFKARHPELAGVFDAVLSVHYDANIYNGQGGWFWDRARNDPRAADSDRWGAIFQRRYLSLPGCPPLHLERRNPNTSDYHLWRQLGAFPQLLVEHGVGAPGAPDHDWLRANVDAIAATHVQTLVEFLAISTPARPRAVIIADIRRLLDELERAR